MSCDANIYGPFSQTLFCGASISTFSNRIGWNSNESSLDVEVVEDPCSSDKVYYACDTSVQTHTGADAFMPPPLGSPIYFQFGSLSYTGIVRNWKEKLDSAKTYTVNCSGPNVILDAVKVIIGGYTGDVFGIPNIINVYGFLEEYAGGICPVDTSLYSLLGYYPALGFGGAGKNDAGISWNSIRTALGLIIADPAPLSGKFGGRPQFKGYSYFVDISELPLTMDDFRISGDSISLLDLINTICDYSGVDWFADLVITDGGTCNTGDFNAFLATDAEIYIKIHTASRLTQPADASNIDQSTSDINTRLNLGTISSFISSIDKVSADRGIELRPEVTNALVVGDQRQDLWTVNNVTSGNNTYNNYIWQYWGKDANGYPIIGSGYLDNHAFDLTVTDIYDALSDPSISGALGHTYNVTVGELLAILGEGGKTNWEAYIEESNKLFGSVQGEQLSNLLGLVEGDRATIIGVKGNVIDVKANNIQGTSLYSANKAASITTTPDEESVGQRLFNKLEGYANEYLGRKFLVQPPIVCSAIDGDSPYNVKLNWEESEGGWSDYNPWGLSNTNMELFRLDDGRIKCMMQFANSGWPLDMTNWDSAKYIQTSSGSVIVEAAAEEIVFLDPINRLYPRVVVSIDKSIGIDKVYVDEIQEMDVHTAVGVVANMFGVPQIAVDFAKRIFGMPGGDTAAWETYPMPLSPQNVVVPLKSNVLKYGPWYAGSFAAAGPTNFEMMSDLNPWTYGSTANMNVVGQLIANTRVMQQQVIEMGSITVPGSPAYSLGSDLGVSAPEITNVDVSIGNDGVRTTYQLRTFTPDYNTLSKTRIDNIRKAASQTREIQRLNNLARINQKRTPTTNNALGTIINRADRYRRTSSHAFYLASTDYDYDPLPGLTNSDVSATNQIYRTDKIIDSVVSTEFSKCLPALCANDSAKWIKRAGVEPIGLFRPFATKSGEVSLMASFPTGINAFLGTPSGNENLYNYSNLSVYEFRGPTYNEALPPSICASLSPFLQTDKVFLNEIAANINCRDPYNPNNLYIQLGSGTSHDIEYVIRDGSYPINLSIKYPQNNYSDAGWYRSIGMKGPPVIVGWGLDVYGKPVPNKDEVVGSGGRSPEFANDWLQRPDLWKAGPLDIRWDYKRGVWTSPPSTRLVQAWFDGSEFGSGMYSYSNCIDSGIYNMQIMNAKIVNDNIGAYDSNGNDLDKYIGVHVESGFLPTSGSVSWIFYNTDKQQTNNVGSGLPNYTKYDLVSYDILRPCRLATPLISGGSGLANFLVGQDRSQSGIQFPLYDSPKMITDGMQIPSDSNAWTIWDSVQHKWVLGIPSICEESQ